VKSSLKPLETLERRVSSLPGLLPYQQGRQNLNRTAKNPTGRVGAGFLEKTGSGRTPKWNID